MAPTIIPRTIPTDTARTTPEKKSIYVYMYVINNCIVQR